MRRSSWIPALLLLVPLPAMGQQAGTDSNETTRVVEHQVKQGETLWSISRAYFGDGFAWRQILAANEERIANPRWIEAGQVLLIPARVAGADAGTQVAARVPEQSAEPVTVTTSDPGARVQGFTVTTIPRTTAPTTPPAVRRFGQALQGKDGVQDAERTIFYSRMSGLRPGTSRVVSDVTRMQDAAVLLTAVPRDVFYTAGWMIPVEAASPAVGTIADFASRDRGRIFDRTTAYPYDRLRVELEGGVSPAVGDQLMTFRMGREIEGVGRVVRPTGIVTVTNHEPDAVVVELSEEYGRVDVGDGVVVLPAFPLQAGESAAPTTMEISGTILTFQDEHLVQSLGSVAYLDFGAGSGVAVGDEFEVYSNGNGRGEPEVIGRLQVVGVHEDHTAARIIELAAPLFVEGLGVRLVAKMP